MHAVMEPNFLSEAAAFFDKLLGLNANPQTLTISQISVRALLIYLAGYAMLRFGEHRFLGKNSAFDVVLGFIFGSLLSRAINGSGPFLVTIAAGAVLLTLHWLFATAALYSDRISNLITGLPIPLIKNGEIQENALRQSRITENMLQENLRIQAHLTDPEKVQEAYYEPSGEVSVIPKKNEGHVVEVKVEEDVQTIRIRLE